MELGYCWVSELDFAAGPADRQHLRQIAGRTVADLYVVQRQRPSVLDGSERQEPELEELIPAE